MDPIAIVTNNGRRQLCSPAQARLVISKGWGKAADELNQQALQAYVASLATADQAETIAVATVASRRRNRSR